jgi:uncharacterized protein (TIGR01777 family)
MDPVRVVITGGRGFLGQVLADALIRDGHEVVALTRDASSGEHGRGRAVTWAPDGSVGQWADTVDGALAVVNLAGESIAGRRWTAAQKNRIRNSRILATKSIVGAVMAATRPPAVLVSGSAVGYYGPCGDELVTEETPAGRDFLAQVGAAWEAEARAAGARTRVVCIRTGLVMHRRGGALPPMLPPFWFGAGGPVGSGRQYWPWIHWQDWVDLVRFAIRTESASGPMNATAPNPVTNRDFARALGRALHRPAFMPAPAFALALLLGEMADALILSGQRAVPASAERLGFRFSFRGVEETLRAVMQ